MSLQSLTVNGVPITGGGGGATTPATVLTLAPQTFVVNNSQTQSPVQFFYSIPSALVAGNIYQVYWRITSATAWNNGSIATNIYAPSGTSPGIAGDVMLAGDYPTTPPGIAGVQYQSQTMSFVAPSNGTYNILWSINGTVNIAIQPYLIRINGT
jgi:hypothetical protein